MGVRRLRALVNGLPRESSFVRRVAPQAEWTPGEYLLATLTELVDLNNRLFLQANTKRGTTMPKPIVISRPGQEQPKPRNTLRDFFGRGR